VELLLQHGADVLARDVDGRSAFICAARTGRVPALQLLVLAADEDPELRGRKCAPCCMVLGLCEQRIYNEH
jgi:ankyrin repeat protein